MKTNILEYLVEAAEQAPDKKAYFDEEISYTYARMLSEVKAIGAKLIKKLNVKCRPVLIYMEKSPACIAAFWGTVASRNFYVPLDTNMPEMRIRLIVENLKPAAVITDMAHYDLARKFSNNVFIFEEMTESTAYWVAGTLSFAGLMMISASLPTIPSCITLSLEKTMDPSWLPRMGSSIAYHLPL